MCSLVNTLYFFEYTRVTSWSIHEDIKGVIPECITNRKKIMSLKLHCNIRQEASFASVDNGVWEGVQSIYVANKTY